MFELIVISLVAIGVSTLRAGGLQPEVEKVVNPVILDDRKYFQNQNLAENISQQ